MELQRNADGTGVEMAVKDENPDVNFADRRVRFFPAIKDGRWLAMDSDMAVQLRHGRLPDGVDEMKAEHLELKGHNSSGRGLPRWERAPRRLTSYTCWWCYHAR